MRLFTPDNLHYPIKVTQLLRKAGEDIEQNDALFAYEYTSTVIESSADRPEGYEVERTWPARFESELEGKLEDLVVSVGKVLTRRTHVADIEEACKHDVQFGGMCAICGKDLTTSSTYNSTMKDTERATVNTVHGHTALLISHSEASRADEEAKRRLLESRKLSLVVDLDQTIIHATVDPTVSEWQRDPSNPNHNAVKDVRAFQLIDEGPGARACWYYIKLRPGLAEFLTEISKYYELHIYTMGTRAYAENIAKLVDPDRKIFADRILSRDESGSLTAKSLKRLFPVDTRMVIIIDDRGDVWQWISNLIKVSVFDFFVGIGDINSSFLPKRPELEARPSPKLQQPTFDQAAEHGSLANGSATQDTAESNGESNGELSTVDQLVSMAGKQDADSMKEKTEEQDSALASQLADRPLLQKQKFLDAADTEAKTSPAVEATAQLLAEPSSEGNDTDKDVEQVFEHPRYRHNLLQDDDTELIHLSDALQQVHAKFFAEYDDRRARMRHKSDTQEIPDAAEIMRVTKLQVLAGVHLVFSGVVPIGVDIFAHDTVIWARSFGAQVSEEITKKTTHVVASPERRTAKVRQAARKAGRIKIVSVAWLMACFSQWRRVDETPYKIHSDAEHRAAGIDGGLPDSFGDDGMAALSSSEEGDAATEDDAEDTGMEDLVINTQTTDDTDDELAKYGPSMHRKDSSPTGAEHDEDWNDIDAELADFLGSDADDDTDAGDDGADESVSFELDVDSRPPNHSKRKREDASTPDLEPASDIEGSRLQKRKKEALTRTSSLTQMAFPPEPNNALLAEEDENDELEAALTAELLGDGSEEE